MSHDQRCEASARTLANLSLGTFRVTACQCQSRAASEKVAA